MPSGLDDRLLAVLEVAVGAWFGYAVSDRCARNKQSVRDILGVEDTVCGSVSDRLRCPPFVKVCGAGVYCMGSEM
jgi:hypothetical protein